MEKVESIESNEELEKYSLSQIKAGPYTALQVSEAILKDPDLASLFPPMDILSAGRTICGITAVSAGINMLKNKRQIGDNGNAPFLVGDFYKYMLQYQGYKSHVIQDGYENGWWVINPNTKDVYHHALVAWAESFDCEARQVYNFNKIEDLADFIQSGGVAIVSVSNKFVQEVTSGNDPKCFTEKEGKTFMLIENEDGSITEREFRTNSHLLTVVGVDLANKEVTLFDSFQLRQQKNKKHVRTIPIEVFNKFLNPGRERAILLSNIKIQTTNRYKTLPIYIPEEVRSLLRKEIIENQA